MQDQISVTVTEFIVFSKCCACCIKINIELTEHARASKLFCFTGYQKYELYGLFQQFPQCSYLPESIFHISAAIATFFVHFKKSPWNHGRGHVQHTQPSICIHSSTYVYSSFATFSWQQCICMYLHVARLFVCPCGSFSH